MEGKLIWLTCPGWGYIVELAQGTVNALSISWSKVGGVSPALPSVDARVTTQANVFVYILCKPEMVQKRDGFWWDSSTPANSQNRVPVALFEIRTSEAARNKTHGKSDGVHIDKKMLHARSIKWLYFKWIFPNTNIQLVCKIVHTYWWRCIQIVVLEWTRVLTPCMHVCMYVCMVHIACAYAYVIQREMA